MLVTFNFRMKYASYDFLIDLGITDNFDTQQAMGAGLTDYLLPMGLGWECSL